jgi:hypothetical protein
VRRFPVTYLLVTTLAELAALPFHLVSFALRRKAIRAEIAALLAARPPRRP